MIEADRPLVRFESGQQPADMLVRIKLRMVVVAIKARQIIDHEKISLLCDLADPEHHARLDLNEPVAETVHVGEGDVVVVSAAERKMKRELRGKRVLAKRAADQTLAAWFIVRRQWSGR